MTRFQFLLLLRFHRIGCIFALAAVALAGVAAAQGGPGDLDPAFDPGVILSGGSLATVHAMAVENDGDVIVVGDFTSIGGTARGRIARIKADGTLDATFANGVGANGPIYCVEILDDGGILIGGDFQSYDGTSRSRIAKLSSSGTLNGTFNPGTGADGPVYAVAEFDGDLWAGGDFTHYDGMAVNRIVQLSKYGLPYFGQPLAGGCDGTVRVMLVGESSFRQVLYLGGEFQHVGGQPRPYLARVNYFGNLDPALTDGAGPDGPVLAMAAEPSYRASSADQGLLIGGSFTSVDGHARGGVARIVVDSYDLEGLDLFFTPWVSGVVRAIVPQYESVYDPPVGMVLAGDFTAVNGLTREGIARCSLLPVENPDYPYNTGLVAQVDVDFGTNGGLDGVALAAAARPDGLTYVGGSFENVSGSPRTALARVYGEYGGTLPGSPGSPAAVALSGDEILLTWVDGSNAASHLVERSPNGVDSWTSLGSGTSPFANHGLDPGEEYFYRITSMNPNGAGSPSVVVSATTEAYDWTGPGALDVSVSWGVNGTVYASVLQADGKTLIGGDFSSVGGVARDRVARLNTDGSVDLTFDPGDGPNSSVRAIDVAGDGKIVIGGFFSSVDGTPRNSVAVLLADGSLDMGFDPGNGPSSSVYAVAFQGDGGVLIGGVFSRVAGYSQDYIARLLPDGGLDLGFRTSPVGSVYSIEVLPDERILIGGFFTSVTGVSVRGVARLMADGTVDSSFDPGSGVSGVYSIARMADGRLVIGGTFTSFDGQTRKRVARLDADGALDPTFDPGGGPSSTVYDVAVDHEGRVLVGGTFTSVGGETCFRLARLGGDGALDHSFRTGSGFNSTVQTVLVQSDGAVLVGGSFSRYQGLTQGRLVRLAGGTVPPLEVVTAGLLPSATTGVAYAFPLSASGGAPGFTWSLVSGSLPAGIELMADGMLSGVATTSGVSTGTLKVTDFLGTEVEMAFELNVIDGLPLDYAGWVGLHFTPAEALDPLVSGEDIDTDGDGLSNLLESAFGGNPKVPDAGGQLPVIAVVDGHYELSFFCDANRTDLTYTVETVVDPSASPWTGIASCSGGGLVSPSGGSCSVFDPGGGLRQVTLTGISPVSEDPAALFRVRVEIPE